MSDESYNVPIEGESSGPVDVPVNIEEPQIQRVPVTPDPLAGLPADVKQEALAAKIAALNDGKTVKEADKAQASVVSDYLWDGRIESAKRFFKWCAVAAALSGIYWLAAHDWTPKEYRPARSAMERSVKVAKAQYKVDVATVELQEAKR